MLKFVDLETARGAEGVRIVVAGTVPSPWSEATKGLFHLAKIPVLAVRRSKDTVAIDAWTGTDNTPVVFCDRAPARASWVAITGLAARLAPGVLLADEPRARAEVIGAIESIAGEGGLGWTVRLWMIHSGLTTNGAVGCSPGVAAYLAKRYGYTVASGAGAIDRVSVLLRFLRELLAERAYFGGDAPNALDVYAASFLTMLSPLDEAVCPACSPSSRKTFNDAAAALGHLVPAALVAQRTRMFERHLPWPIAL